MLLPGCHTHSFSSKIHTNCASLHFSLKDETTKQASCHQGAWWDAFAAAGMVKWKFGLRD